MKFFKEVWENLKFTWKYVKEQKLSIIGFGICNIISIIICVIVPIISAKIIVNLTESKFNQLLLMALLLFLIENVRNFINFLGRKFAQTTYRESFCKLQVDLGRTILKLKNDSLDKHSSGLFIQRLTGDTSKMADVFNILSYHLSDILTNIGIFVA